MWTSLLLQCSLILYDDSLLLRAICRGIGKAETMVYGRYENGQREPSYPTVGFIAQTFNCNIDFLYGTSDKTDPDYIIVSSSNDPELYSLIKMIKQDSNVEGRILTYARKLLEK